MGVVEYPGEHDGVQEDADDPGGDWHRVLRAGGIEERWEVPERPQYTQQEAARKRTQVVARLPK